MKRIFYLIIFAACCLSTYAGKKDTLEIHNLRVQNEALLKYIQEIEPEDDGYQVIEMSPIEKLALEVGTNEIRAFGIGESVKEQLARNVATAHASAALQRKIELYVRYGLDQYNSSVETNCQYGLDERTREQVVSACKGIIEGIVIVDTRKLYNKSTRKYKYEVCVKYDKSTVLSIISEQEARIRANEKQFEHDMREAWDELDAYHNSKVNRVEPVVAITETNE